MSLITRYDIIIVILDTKTSGLQGRTREGVGSGGSIVNKYHLSKTPKAMKRFLHDGTH